MSKFMIDNVEVTLQEFKRLLSTDMNKCNYRNCGTCIPPHKKYCCRQHKEYENTYIKRENRGIQKEKERVVDMLNQIESCKPSDDLIELFKKVSLKK